MPKRANPKGTALGFRPPFTPTAHGGRGGCGSRGGGEGLSRTAPPPGGARLAARHSPQRVQHRFAKPVELPFAHRGGKGAQVGGRDHDAAVEQSPVKPVHALAFLCRRVSGAVVPEFPVRRVNAEQGPLALAGMRSARLGSGSTTMAASWSAWAVRIRSAASASLKGMTTVSFNTPWGVPRA